MESSVKSDYAPKNNDSVVIKNGSITRVLNRSVLTKRKPYFKNKRSFYSTRKSHYRRKPYYKKKRSFFRKKRRYY